ncbi:MAG: hypothetical protein KatS3mg105_3276 [Gemmatales bacterium]|nr:MAG: hypothetical protein KatS3mg105_3276 [Gemmatales bacterium]
MAENNLPKKATDSVPKKFREQTQQIAAALLREWVGEDRANEAVGRVATAISASAARG